MRRAVLTGIVAVLTAACGTAAGEAPGTAAEPTPTSGVTPESTTESPSTAPPTSAPSTTPSTTPATAPPPTAPAGDTWRAVRGTVDGEWVELHSRPEITLTIDSDRFSGVAACNGYQFTDSDPGPQVGIDGIAVDEIGCDPFVTELQDLYLGSLGPTASYEIAGDGLRWTSEHGSWAFERIEPTPLVGPVWVLDGIVDAQTSMTFPGVGAARLEFFADGTLFGSTGCRTLGGTWSLDAAGVVSVEAFPVGECTGPLGDLDGTVTAVVESGITGRIDGALLHARTAAGTGLDFVARSVADDDAAHRRLWKQQEPPAYTFVYGIGGMCTTDFVRVHVVGGAVTSAEPVEMGCGSFDLADAPTIDDVFDQLTRARSTAVEVSVVWDPNAGFPSHVFVDEDWMVSDEEYGFSITEFALG